MNATQSIAQPAESKAKPSHRLVFPHGIANLTIRVDGSMAGPYRGEFSGPKPVVTETEGMVSVDYPRFNPLRWSRTSADIAISPKVPWNFEIRGGVAHWQGDLRSIELTGIEVRGGLSHVELRLPQPQGSIRVHVGGGASHLTLRRPAGSGARLQIGGGASRLVIDAQQLGAVGGPVALETPGYSAGGDRYTVEIGGGASKIQVTQD